MPRKIQVGCVFPKVIRSEFRMGQYGDDEHRENVPHFIFLEKCAKYFFFEFYLETDTKSSNITGIIIKLLAFVPSMQSTCIQ